MESFVGVFISYSHQNKFEATILAHELAKIGCHCWIDFKGIPGGAPWRESIEQGLQNSIIAVIVLTPEALQSNWVMIEIKTALEHGLLLLPIMFRKCTPPDILEPYQYLDFTQGPDYESLYRSIMIGVTSRLINTTGAHKISTAEMKLRSAENFPEVVLPPPTETIERPDGTMRAESLFYIERQGDHVLRRELAGQGATVVIKAPRQVGKSSMLAHSIPYAHKQGKHAIVFDFQSLDTLNDPSIFYPDFCATIATKLGLPDETAEVWKRFRSNTRAATVYMEENIIARLDAPLVIYFDETDRMFDCPFRSDFFGMLRSWHNARGTSGETWHRLDIVLVISTEPYMLIDNSAQSPFNVGEIIQLEDFSRAHVQDLNRRHDSPFSTRELDALYELLSGHPYLVRQAMYRVAVRQVAIADVLDESNYTRGGGGIFAEHLRRYQSYFNERPDLKRLMLEIIYEQGQPSEDDYNRLRGAGLVRQSEDTRVYARCKLYALYFGAKLR